MSTQTIDSQIVHLESLYKAYAEILDQAKQQLETLEVTASTVEKLATSLKENSSFRSSITQLMMNELRNDLNNMDHDVWNCYATAPFLKEIAKKVVELAKPEIKQVIVDLIESEVNSPQLRRKLEAKVLEHDGIESALKIQKAIAGLVKTDS